MKKSYYLFLLLLVAATRFPFMRKRDKNFLILN